MNGKGDYSTIQDAIEALPTTHAGEILVKGGEYVLSKAVTVKASGYRYIEEGKRYPEV